MRALIVLCFAFGCGFASRATGDGGSSGDSASAPLDARRQDAAPPDAAVLDGDGPGSGVGGTSDCLQRWMDGAPRFANLRQMTELSSNSWERDPWISDDGLRLYFARKAGTRGDADIHLVTRGSPAASFGTPVELVNLNRTDDDDRPALSGDELTIVFARDPSSGGNARVLLARRNQRSDVFPSPDSSSEALVQAVNMDSADHFDPFLSRDGLRLYLAPRVSGRQQIMVATRSRADDAFSVPAPVRGIDRNASDPALSSDERILVFSSTSGSGGNDIDLWYATRSNPNVDFVIRGAIPMLNGAADDGDPMLSADGCELYFSSARGGLRHIWHADMITD